MCGQGPYPESSVMGTPETQLELIHQLQAGDRRRAAADREARSVIKRRRRWWQKKQ